MMKRGQAAMEFLMSYGWAILIVIVAVTALSYFGVLDFGGTNNCVGESPFDCPDFKVNSSHVVIYVRSSAGDTTIHNVTMSCDGSTWIVNATSSASNVLLAGNRAKLTWDAPITGCGSMAEGSRFKARYVINYATVGQSDHQSPGILQSTVESS